MAQSFKLEVDRNGYLLRLSGDLEKRRPGTLFSGWKRRFHTLAGQELSWSEGDGEWVMSSLDLAHAEVFGSAPESLRTVSVRPRDGKILELRAGLVSEYRLLLQLLRAAARSARYKPEVAAQALRRPCDSPVAVLPLSLLTTGALLALPPF